MYHNDYSKMAEHTACDTIREVIFVVTCCDRYQTDRTAFIVDYISSHEEFMQIGPPAVFCMCSVFEAHLLDFWSSTPSPPPNKPPPNDQPHRLNASASVSQPATPRSWWWFWHKLNDCKRKYICDDVKQDFFLCYVGDRKNPALKSLLFLLNANYDTR